MLHFYASVPEYITEVVDIHGRSSWVAKVGLDWVVEQIADADTRRALVDRFEISQSVYRTDPWAEHARPSERPAWQPLADLTLEAAE